MTTRSALALALATTAGLAGVGACTAPAELSADAADAGAAEPPAASARLAIECPAWGCGSNAATVGDGLVFHELDADGGLNSGGVRIVAFELGDLHLTADVDRDRLLGISDDGRAYAGTELIGAVLVLEHVTPGGHVDAHYFLRIVDASPNYAWFWAGVRSAVWAYNFEVRRSLDDTQVGPPLCRGLDPGERWPDRRMAIVFRGDRYNAERKKVQITGPGDSWFNLACAGTAVAKMHLLRHTTAGSSETHRTNLQQRQALLKMLTADYCGNGHSFTVDGQPLRYMDARGWYPGWPPLATPIELGNADDAARVEALWDHQGAVCLNQPRRAARAEVSEACRLPRCPDSSWLSRWPRPSASGADGRGYVLSALPRP